MPLDVTYGVEVHLRSGRTLKTEPMLSVAGDGTLPEHVAMFITQQIVSEIQDVTNDRKFLEVLQCAGQDGLVLINPAEIEFVNVVILRLAQSAPPPPTPPEDGDGNPPLPSLADGLPVA